MQLDSMRSKGQNPGLYECGTRNQYLFVIATSPVVLEVTGKALSSFDFVSLLINLRKHFNNRQPSYICRRCLVNTDE